MEKRFEDYIENRWGLQKVEVIIPAGDGHIVKLNNGEHFYIFLKDNKIICEHAD